MLYDSHVFSLALAIIPFLFYVMLFFKRKTPFKIQHVHISLSVILIIFVSILLGFFPVEYDTDKERYADEYLGFTFERDNDIGWMWYNVLMRFFLGDNVWFFFLITATFYVFSYYVLAKVLFPKEYVGYFLIMAIGSLGFAGYGSNTIRSGLALAIIFYSMSVSGRLWLRLLLLLFAISIHKSMVIIIAAYIGGIFLPKIRMTELFWMLCLIIAILGIDITILFEKIGFVDDRVLNYASTIDGSTDYKVGFRLDFFTYSVVPIAIARIWMHSFNYHSVKFEQLYKAYILANSIWLLCLNIEFNDRIAYLSWVMIPIITLYPLLSNELKVKNAQKTVMIIMGMFIGLNVILSLR